MTADNFDSVLAGLRQRQPFRVFTVELHGGERFEGDHPGALVVRDGVAVTWGAGPSAARREWRAGKPPYNLTLLRLASPPSS